MKQEVISAKMNDAQVKLTKNLVSEFKEANRDAKISGPKFGKIADAILMSLKIDEEHYIKFIKILLGNDIKVLFTKNSSPRTKQIIDEYESRKKEAELRNKLRQIDDKAAEAAANQPKANPDKDLTIQDIEKLINKGNYRELIRISKSINCPPKVCQYASENIAGAAKNSIEELVAQGIGNKNRATEVINKLLVIASDKDLRVTNDISILKDAGIAAIEVASSTDDTIDELIKICNNNALHHSVTVMSAVKFSETVFENEALYKDDIDIAVRSLSTRWMNIAYDVARRDMSEEDVKKFNQLLDYIDSKR